jgi:hypothetical protein
MRTWIVEVHTILGVKKKGLLAKGPDEAKAEVARLQLTTNKFDIAYVPPGEIGAVYERPIDKPLPPAFNGIMPAVLR